MNKFTMTAIAALMCTSTVAMAQDGVKNDKMMHDKMMHDTMMSNMKAMDTNGDGMISNDEYMKSDGATADHWASMKKNKDGMVPMKDMQMDHDMMMKKDGMMKDGKMMKDHKMMKDDSMKKGG